MRADGTVRPSYGAVRDTIAQTGGSCTGSLVSWRHASGVVGASADFGSLSSKIANENYWAFRATAQEDASYVAGVYPASGGAAVLSAKGLLKAYYTPLFKLPQQTLKPGSYVYKVTLTATTNPDRVSSFASAPFQVGSTAAAKSSTKKHAKPKKHVAKHTKHKKH